jgi:predicted amidohydrolase YtcJ
MKSPTTILLSAETIFMRFNPMTTCQSLLLHEGRVLAAGAERETEAIAKKLGGEFQRKKLPGKIVLPGLIDAHIHLEQFSRSLKIVDCETDSLQECLLRLKEKSNNTPAGDWILGHGWNENQWKEPVSAQILDENIPDRPVYISAKSLHAGVANRLALEIAGIGPNTIDPAGGQIGRTEDGNLTGVVYENAIGMITAAIPKPDVRTLSQDLKVAQETLWGFGLTGVHDFDGARCFSALQILKEQGDLGLRVVKSIPIDLLDHAVEIGLHSGFGDDWIRIGNVKVFSDGALGPRTAAMIEPYLEDPENRGMLLIDQEELYEVGKRAVSSGLGLTVHAIGDRANHEVFQAYSRLREYEFNRNIQPLRHRIEHLQLLHPLDLGECARLDVIASMQPIHATSDMEMADRYWGERAKFAYAWRSQLDHATALAFGSDAPVESPNPFWGIHAAVTRQRPNGSPGESGWYPDQRLSSIEAFVAYTSGPAYAGYSASNQGHLMPGANADLIVLEENPFKMEHMRIKDLQPIGTMVAGCWRYKIF